MIRRKANTPVGGRSGSFFENLPDDLLLSVASNASLQVGCYCVLIQLSHSLRTRLRGAIKVMNFAPSSATSGDPEQPNRSFDYAPIPTAPALSELVAPCSNLRELHLHPGRALTQCGREADTFRVWIDAGFGNHKSLAILDIPCCVGLTEPAMCRLVSRLPGLEELTLGSALTPGLNLYFGNAFLTSLGLHCTKLVSLTLHLHPEVQPSYALLRACASLARVIVSCDPDGSLRSLVRHLPSLEVLIAPSSSAFVFSGLIGTPHTVDLFLRTPDDIGFLGVRPLPRLVDCALRRQEGCEPMSLATLRSFTGVHSATLERLTLDRALDVMTAELVECLAALPALRSLSLTFARQAGPLPVLTALLQRLTAFSLVVASERPVAVHGASLLVCGPFLRTFRLVTSPPLSTRSITFDCPCLATLEFPRIAERDLAGPVMLQCPALTRLINAPALCRLAVPAPRLALVRGCFSSFQEPLWFPPLRGSRIRTLCCLRIGQLGALEELCAGVGYPGLESLASTYLDAPILPALPEFVLRTGDVLSNLEISTTTYRTPVGHLHLDAPGLSRLSLVYLGLSRLTLRCPRLATLHLATMGDLTRVDFCPHSLPPLRRLNLGECPQLQQNHAVALVTQPAATLVSLQLADMPPGFDPLLGTLLRSLPILHHLRLSRFGCGELTIDAARLVQLELIDNPALARVALYCNCLEGLEIRSCPRLKALGLEGSCRFLLGPSERNFPEFPSADEKGPGSASLPRRGSCARLWLCSSYFGRIHFLDRLSSLHVSSLQGQTSWRNFTRPNSLEVMIPVLGTGAVRKKGQLDGEKKRCGPKRDSNP
ncbi:hypothetical protein PAPYR_1009 [Paratrimastix pyriformis]|uniref:Uncharacterized protein n=1 Tax=Paratrimastix pyriformis TaxID=342808 RepID=A0ABQ8UTD0_9EUKA|nr:hypothetical protein PAPYR_1009 [Paratrimastix pyriformis]